MDANVSRLHGQQGMDSTLWKMKLLPVQYEEQK
jgi:hypothetical protein